MPEKNKKQEKSKRSSDNYIYFRKKITDKEKIKAIDSLAKSFLLTRLEMCERIFCDALANINSKVNQ